MSDPWTAHVERWRGCQRCPLARQRGNICLARGDLPCDVLLVGEAPGISEDALGRPFVGPAGMLLDQIVERALPHYSAEIMAQLGLTADCPPGIALDYAKEAGLAAMDEEWATWAFTNLVACFPREAKARGDNEPERGEVLECRPRLVEMVNVAQPRLIVRVGRLAEHYLNFDRSVPTVDIEHPASILRKPLAAQRGATQKCVVQLRNAWEVVCAAGPKPWRPWGSDHAEGQGRNGLRTVYREAGAIDGDDVPF